MPVSNSSGWGILAVLEIHAQNSGSHQENHLKYLAIMVLKACMNVCCLACNFRSLQRSLVGISTISLCLADTLLLVTMAGSRALGGHLSASAFLCLVMSHASTVYSLLPVPFLLLGVLDYARNLSRSGRPMSTYRALSYHVLVLSVWSLAGLYSYHYTNSQVTKVSEDQETLRVCIVQSSSVVMYFCTGLSLAVACVLLFYCRREPRYLKALFAWSWLRVSTLPCRPQRSVPSGPAEHREAQPDVPLLLRLTLGFIGTWAPFLALNVAAVLLNLAVPSLLSVNILWLLCTNSLLIGAALWRRGSQAVPCDDLPDETCAWSLYWHHGNRGTDSSTQEKLPLGVYTLPSSSSTNEKLHI